MNILKQILPLLFVVLLFGCKDSCDELTCYNGGYCDNGQCFCIGSWTGTDCSINPCDNVNCIHGTCDQGVCICPGGYSGEFCEIQDTTLGATITAIEIRAFNPVDTNGVSWDDNSGPDILLRIDGGVIINLVSNTNLDVSQDDLPLTISDNLPITVEASTQYSFRFYDSDTFSDTWMVEFSIIPDENDTDWPEFISYTNDGWNIRIYMDWIY